MPILTENVKLMASQRLADTDDGGGRMTGNEIVDGNVNNLFPDISRLDRVYGRVSLREAFVSIQTPDTETYSGAHVILSAPAKDPNVSVCMFTTGNNFDQRTVARDRVESYVTLGPRYPGWLWGDHPEGSRSLLIFQIKGSKVPDIGGVLYLVNNKGLANEKFQYVRITKVELSSAQFTALSDSAEYGAQALAFNRDILKIEIGDPLRETFTGIEISQNDSLPTSVYTTTVSDAAKYYGVMLPTAPITAGDISINVDSIFTHLVPSAQGESPMVDLSVGEAGPVIGSGVPYSFVASSFKVETGAQLHFGRGIKPGTLSVAMGNGTVYDDQSDGIVYQNAEQRGVVDYATGVITFSGIVTAYTANAAVSAIIGVEVRRVPSTAFQPVFIANRGYNFTKILEPLPIPGSVWVDFMAQGKWYRLTDNGKGTLVSAESGGGTGTVNYVTGSLIVTCGALPDINTAIIYNWGNPIETVDLSGEVEIAVAEVVHQLPGFPVQPGSVTITWPTAIGQAVAYDVGLGYFTSNAEGWINYSTGEMAFKPTALPTSGGEYTIRYELYDKIDGSVSGGAITNALGIWTFTLPEGPIQARSLGIDVVVNFSGYPHVYHLQDVGSGNLTAPGWQIEVPVSHPTWPGSTAMSGISGTVDYVNRVVHLNLSNISGVEKWKEPYEKIIGFDHTVAAGVGWSVRAAIWAILYKPEHTVNIAWANGVVGEAAYSYSLSESGVQAFTEIVASKPFTLDLTPNNAGLTILPGSVNFSWSGHRFIDRLGKLYRNPDPRTGLGAEAGVIDYSTGIATLSVYDGGSNIIVLNSLAARIGNQLMSSCVFRTPGAPLRPGSISIIGTTIDGLTISATSNFDGTITGAHVIGNVDYEKGMVWLTFGEYVADSAEYYDAPWYSAVNVIDGQIFKPQPAFADTLSYTCVAYSYIPLDADLIGLDPVRLPSDGRVPIVKTGDVVVIHNTQAQQLANPLIAGQGIILSRDSISSVELYDSSPLPLRVPSTKYIFDKDLQSLQMTDPLDLTGFTQPIIVSHRVEDMALVSGVQIGGQIIVSPPVQNDYPTAQTYVSTAVLYGDMQARIFGLFDQKTWNSVWSNNLSGDPTNSNYNEIDYPLLVTNDGAVTERWGLLFTDTAHFVIIGEAYGVVGSGYITQDCFPINPATNRPFFSIKYLGWGSGWAAGNILRFNTEGANRALWVARTTLQGPATEPNDQFTIQIRGDAE